MTCKISGGKEDVNIEHVHEVQGDNYLSSLSNTLTGLKDRINMNLSELVEREKALQPNWNEQSRNETSGSDEDVEVCSKRPKH